MSKCKCLPTNGCIPEAMHEESDHENDCKSGTCDKCAACMSFLAWDSWTFGKEQPGE